MRQFLIAEQKRMIAELNEMGPGHNIEVAKYSATLMELFVANLEQLEDPNNNDWKPKV